VLAEDRPVDRWRPYLGFAQGHYMGKPVLVGELGIELAGGHQRPIYAA
jgi:hypothetical protein